MISFLIKSKKKEIEYTNHHMKMIFDFFVFISFLFFRRSPKRKKFRMHFYIEKQRNSYNPSFHAFVKKMKEEFIKERKKKLS